MCNVFLAQYKADKENLVMENATTPVRAGAVNVPFGHVIGNEKWKGSQIVQGIQGKVKLILEDGLGVVDFHLSNRTCVLYISEADLVAGNGFKRRLVRFRNASSLQGIVIVEKTPISDQYFPAVQKFVVLELGMALLPVANQGEAAQLIIQLVQEQAKDRASNPFLHKKGPQLLEASVFQTVQQIPGVGKTKALLLLEQFGNIHQLCNASLQELEQVVGCAAAQQIHTFFRQSN
ncbi:Fanconi anemia core complex-associated protein 24 isoform X1 [Sphaerodactylus townsendi]|uniref:Fanconi anemia core complex-associated protein 24 n=1 Tax=Sphaerodactylus townsendi TaxID=933632 RepID=A0ACB8EBA9_9SAUR|nr:Fanconi anemia core complex-associated protein 24 isoform X1 [Sphaerodactylus townsendi]